VVHVSCALEHHSACASKPYLTKSPTSGAIYIVPKSFFLSGLVSDPICSSSGDEISLPQHVSAMFAKY
jgi:hypothetical protein